MASPAGDTILGRQAELAVLRGSLDEAGRSGQALLIRGEPGVGKSALLQAAARMATDDGWRVLRTDGTPAEQRLPLAGVHKLLRPVHDEMSRLAPARRETLESAFGLP